MPHRPSRRRLLATAGAAVLLGTTGCVRRLQDAATFVDYPEPEPPSYRRWLPRPDALPATDHYNASYLRVPGLLGDSATARAGIGLRNLFGRTGRDPLGIDPADLEAVVKADLTRMTVLLGTFDPDAVGTAAGRAGYVETDTHRGFTVFERTDRPYAAVGEKAVVLSRSDEAPTVARTVVDTARGDVDRYHEVDDRFARLSQAAGGSTTAWIHPDGGLRPPDGAVGSASAQQFDDGTAFFRVLYLFETAADASESAVRDAVADSFRPRASIDTAVDGRMGRLDVARDVGSVAEDASPTLTPITAWDFAAQGDGVEVTHRAGDPIEAARLTLRGDAGPTDTQFADRYETVEPGDSVAVPVGPGARLRVVWSVDGGTATLATYEGDAG